MARTVLVTGARGFIGGHLVDALVARGDIVVGVDDDSNPTAHTLDAGVRMLTADVRDEAAMVSLVTEIAPTTIFHLAAAAGVRPSLVRPAEYASRNVVGTVNVLTAAHRAGVRAIVLASSSSVYGNRRGDAPFREDDALEPPQSPYAATKHAAEEIAGSLAVPYGLRIATARLFTVYGPRQRSDLAIARFLAAARRGEPITVYGDGSSSRDYTYVTDTVAGLLLAASRADAGEPGMRIHNIASGRPVTLQDLVRTLGTVVGHPLDVHTAPEQPGDVGHTWGSLERATAELGYRPVVDLATGLARQWKSMPP